MEVSGVESERRTAAPFLRWAGGKRWLVPALRGLLTDIDIANYHEPFLGGGSVFLGLSWPGRAYLADSNEQLINTYRAIRDNPRAVSDRLLEHRNDGDYYYWLRENVPKGRYQKAARFIYLNHTSYNGIYRVNLRGEYNVPYGDRKIIKLPTLEDLQTIANKLCKASIVSGDFASSLTNIGPKDFVFLDPPYTVAHNNNGFVKYNQKLFSFDDQKRLRELISEIRERDAYYALTNAAHSSIRELFDHGDRSLITSRRNAIGGRSATRGSAQELLITNLPV